MRRLARSEKVDLRVVLPIVGIVGFGVSSPSKPKPRGSQIAYGENFRPPRDLGGFLPD